MSTNNKKIKNGITNAKAMYVGDKPILKIYINNILVYDNSSTN